MRTKRWARGGTGGLVVAGLLASRAVAAGVGEAAVPDDTTTLRDVAYARRPTGPVTLDLHVPAGTGPFPLVVYVHGGGWREGSKAEWPHFNFLVARGYAVANLEYRFSQVAPFPAQLDDVTAALDFLADHANEHRLDAGRIAVAGESAGGHLASLLGLSRPVGATPPAAGRGRVRAVLDFFGPSDLVPMLGSDKLRDTVDQLLGHPRGPARLAAARVASPVTHVTASAPPFLVVHGTKDELVDVAQSELLVRALKKAGAGATFVPVEGAGHAGPAFWTGPMRAKIVEFLDKTLTR